MKIDKKNTDIIGRVIRLADLVEYQEGTIVSRTIINKDVGTVTAFAFDEGQSLSEHTAPFDAFVYILDGEAEVIIDGKPFHPKKDDMMIMPANRPHAVRGINRFKMLLVMIRK